MPDTYTLKFQKKHKKGRYKLYDIYDTIKECQKQEAMLLKDKQTTQIIKNSNK